LLKTTIILATILVSTNASSEEQNSMSPEEITVFATIEKMTSSLQDADIDAVMATYEKGARVVFEPGDPVSDQAIVRGIFAEMAALKPDVTYSGHEVIIAGDIAVHIAPWQMVGKSPDGEDIQQGGLSVAVLRRQENGSWLMVIDNPYGDRLLSD
jgi:ketosteroid isomerase-like protein